MIILIEWFCKNALSLDFPKAHFPHLLVWALQKLAQTRKDLWHAFTSAHMGNWEKMWRDLDLGSSLFTIAPETGQLSDELCIILTRAGSNPRLVLSTIRRAFWMVSCKHPTAHREVWKQWTLTKFKAENWSSQMLLLKIYQVKCCLLSLALDGCLNSHQLSSKFLPIASKSSKVLPRAGHKSDGWI